MPLHHTPPDALAHAWDLTFPEARAVQEALAPRVEIADRLGPVRYIAGADISYNIGKPTLYAAVVVMDANSLDVVEIGRWMGPATFPYVSGYLSFRELPALEQAFAQLSKKPDLIICDGQGIAHPRRFGLACHLGLRLDIPAIGCAKTRLVGEHQPLGVEKGERAALVYKDEPIGEVLRSRRNTKPLWVSPGHRISIKTATDWALKMAPRYRITEPIRAAHNEVNRLRLEAKAQV